MRPVTARLIGMAALAAVAVLCVWIHAPRIEAALAARAQQVATEQQADWAAVAADGRDIVIRGVAPDADSGERLQAAIASIPGIRSVSLVADDAGAKAPDTPPEPKFVASHAAADAPVVVTGTVPEGTGVEMLTAASPSADVVVENGGLESTSAHLKGAPELLAAATGAAALLDGGQIDITPEDITVSGTDIDGATANAIREKLSPFLGLGYNLVMVGAGSPQPESAATTLPMPAAISGEDDGAASSDDTLAGCQQRLDALLARQGIRFRNGSAALLRDSRMLLDDIATTLNACPATVITITGHTDSRGAADANLALSERRAAAVSDYLAEQGVERDRMTTRGVGETEPVADNATAEGRARNRRIEITLEEGVEQ